MSTPAAVPDRSTCDEKGIVSSLSADAAEFVPLAAPLSEAAGATGKAPSTSQSGRGGHPASVRIRDVPQFLTSCFPFVQVDGELRADANRFPVPIQYPGLSHTVPMPTPAAPVGLPPWQSVRPELMGGFPHAQPPFGSLSYVDPRAAPSNLPEDASSKNEGGGLLPTPLGLPPLSGLHHTTPPGLILTTPQHGGRVAAPPWLLTSAPPLPPPQPQPPLPQHSVFLQHQQQQQQHHVVSLQSATQTTASVQASGGHSALSTTGRAPQVQKEKPGRGAAAEDDRPPSPVLISRSAQTNFPKQIQNSTLKERPHPVYLKNRGKQRQKHSGNESVSTQAEQQDSDSGYSSPLQPKRFISCGTQVLTASLTSLPSPSNHDGHQSGDVKLFATVAAAATAAAAGSKGVSKSVLPKKEEAASSLTEDSGCESRKSAGAKRKKESSRSSLSLRSPHSLASASSKLLSRSSSSISSSGTRPEEDDEKIDLHSWTDFPPMVPKAGGSGGVVGRPALLLPSSQPPAGVLGQPPGEQQDRVPLTIERSAHAPPWTIKYTGGPGDVRSGRSRSSSGETKEKPGVSLAAAATAAAVPQCEGGRGGGGCGGGGGGLKLGQTAASLGDELSKLFSSIETRPLSTSEVPKHTSTSVATTSHLTSSPAASTSTSTTTTTTATVAWSHTRAGVTSTRPSKSVSNSSQPTRTSSVKEQNLPPAPDTAFPNAGLVRPFLGAPPPSSSSSVCAAVVSMPPHLVFSAPGASHPASHPTVPGSVRPPVPLTFRSPPPSGIPPPLPPHPPPHSALNMAAVHAFPNICVNIPPPYHLPPPPLLGQHPPRVNPAFPPPIPFVPPPPLHSRGVSAPPIQPAGSMVYGKAAGTMTLRPQDHRARQAGPSVPYDSGRQNNTASSTQLLPANPNTSANTNLASAPAVAPVNPPPTPQNASVLEQAGPGTTEIAAAEDKKRRRRRRRRGRAPTFGAACCDDPREEGGSPAALEHALSSSNVSESTTLHFEDVDEFPDLLGGGGGRSSLAGEECAAGGAADRATLSGTSLSYSDVIKATWSKASSQSRTQSLTGSCVSGEEEDNISNHTGTSNLSKRARKRRRRREQANKAAEVELAEISLEQQWLQQVGMRKSPTNTPAARGLITNPATVGEAKTHAAGKAGGTGGKKFHQPIAFDIAAMIDAIQKKPAPQALQPADGKPALGGAGSKPGTLRKEGRDSAASGNLMDSTAPMQKRGKEREVPRAKKPSPLKKVILKEREQRKRLRLLDGDPDSAPGISGGQSTGVGMLGGESELSQEALSSKSEGTDEGEAGGGTAQLSADLSPISQTSPISMSPASPGNSGVSSPSAGGGSIGRDPVLMKIHSRRFREYCTQILDKEIDQCCTSLLQELVKFQDRMYHKDPVKAKSKRRVVLGLREVTKHLKLKRIKCVVISPNLEKIQSKGGLDEALNTILSMCQEQNVPFVFALGRRALGRACAKLVPVSVVGIFNYEGCESKYHSLISLTAAARDAYHDMVQAVEREVAEHHPASQASSIGGVPGLFAAHMGHSRTPSGCSAISFTSSILSEPISENFPHAEPEVDSKGYEIVRDAAGNVVHAQEGKSSKSKPLNDVDDGNEADVEDAGETRKKKRAGRNLNSVRFGGNVGAGGVKPCDEGKDGGDGKAGTEARPHRNSSSISAALGDESTLLAEADSNLGAADDKGGVSPSTPDSATGSDRGGRRSVVAEADGGGRMMSGVGVGAERVSSVSHIDSIHSLSYNLGEAILSQHTSLPSAAETKPGRHSAQLSPAGGSSGMVASPRQGDQRNRNLNNGVEDGDNDDDGSDDLRILAVDDDDSIDDNFDDDENEDDENEDNDDDDNDDDDDDEGDDDNGNEEAAEAARSHQRIIDKERIKSWLESQTAVTLED